MRNRLPVLLPLFALLILAGCGQPNSGTNEGSPSTTNPDGSVEVVTVLQEGLLYQTDCTDEKVEIAMHKLPGKVRTFLRSGSAITRASYFFTKDCGSKSISIVESGTVNTPEQNPVDTKTTNPKLSPSQKLPSEELQIQSISITLHKNMLVTAFNKAAICGFTDWTVETPKVLTQETPEIAQYRNCPALSLFQKEALSYQLQQGTLYFATESNSNPPQVNRSLPYKVQVQSP